MDRPLPQCTTQSRRVIGDPKIIFKIMSFREAKPKLKAWQDRVHSRIFQNLTFKGQKGHKKAMNLTFRPLTKFFIANLIANENSCRNLKTFFENLYSKASSLYINLRPCDKFSQQPFNIFTPNLNHRVLLTHNLISWGKIDL